MLVSTFELLVKPQLPKLADISNLPPGVMLPPEATKLARTVLQGYFLTISNLNAFDVTLSLVFTIVLTPPPPIPLPPASLDLLGFLDVDGRNIFELLDVEPDLAANKIRFTRKIPSGDTGLFLIQPNILKPGLLKDAKFELRGYVEVFISSLSTGFNSAKLLLTPEHRGTFYTDLFSGDPVQLDQIAYALPTAHGGSLFELSF